jgi:hypothetical protein
VKKRTVTRELGLSAETFSQYDYESESDLAEIAAEMEAEGTAYANQRTLIFRIADECLMLAAQIPADVADPFPELVRRLRGLADQSKMFATDDAAASLIRTGYALGSMRQMLEHNRKHLIAVSRHRNSSSTGRANRVKGNDARKLAADTATLEAFNRWRQDPRRRSQLSELSPKEQAKKYLKTKSANSRDARRLRAMLKAGTLK